MSKALPRIIWGLVAIVFAIALIRIITTRNHRSNDQQILIEKLKQRN